MDFIDEFILEYKNNPCLWKADSANYKNRTKRQEAYMKLIDVAAKHGEHYNVERTKQKINNLRCAFRHQLKKYTEAKNKGESEGELYCPKRKYFESLLFLKDEEITEKNKRRESISAEDKIDRVETTTIPNITVVYEKSPNIISVQNLNDEYENNGESLVHNQRLDAIINSALVTTKEPSLNTSSIIEYEEVNPDEVSSIHKEVIETQISEYDKESGGYHIRKSARRRRQRSLSESSHDSDLNLGPEHQSKHLKIDVTGNDFEQLLSMACRNAQQSTEDSFTNFGKLVAHKLRTMETAQANLAEKIITDVLFQGHMKLLTVLSVNRFGNLECTDANNEMHMEK